MKLTGSYKLNVKKEIVWDALNNPEILKQCIPGCDSFEKENDSTFNASATNQIGPMNATFSGTISLSNIKENVSYTITGEGQSSVGFANGNADVKLFEENGATTLSYEVSINVGGKIQSVYNFVKKYNPNIKKNYAKKILGKNFPLNPSMNINKFIKIIKPK